MLRSIAIYPRFDKHEAIQRVRARFDRLAQKVPPHLTLVFPFESTLATHELAAHLRRATADHEPFAVSLGQAFHDGGTVHLPVVDGASALRALHERVYSGVLKAFLNTTTPYVPHLTVGRDLGDPAACLRTAVDITGARAVAESVACEIVADDEASILELEVPFATTRLIEASLAWADPFLALVDALRRNGEPLLGTEALDRNRVADYVARLIDQQEGRGLENGQVPMTTLWLVHEGREVIGISRVRHRLTDTLRQHGGHIGFLIRPSFRRMGFGRQLLALSLAKARELGIDRALLTCDSDNLGSRRIIEANGGLLEAETASPQTGKLIRRYWIAVT